MPSQDIILSEIRPEDREEITAILRGHDVRLAEDMLPAERWALACPALPTCGLALTEAERVRDDIVFAIEERLARYGLERERLSIRITGCPNGCARPYTGDIGIVGRMPGYYALFVGGDFEGTRLNTHTGRQGGAGCDRRNLRPAVRALMRQGVTRRRFWRFLPARRAAGVAASARSRIAGLGLMLPISVDLAQIRVILVGDGAAARRRLALLDEAGRRCARNLCADARARLGRDGRRRGCGGACRCAAEIARAQLVFVAGVAEPAAAEISPGGARPPGYWSMSRTTASAAISIRRR